jgi:hypothetical protein
MDHRVLVNIPKFSNSQYKYLVQGEYIEFVLEKSNSGPHEFKAIEITGIQGGELMCEVVRTPPPTLRNSNESNTQRSGDADGDNF